ncbi:MAG: aldehyde ferredoxin oxidoreductase family protein [Desulfatirhabdiaceae bacterium]
MNGFFNRILVIDATHQTFSTEPINETDLQLMLGGKGLGVSLLLQKNPAGVDPLSPENHLVIALGPTSDSLIYGSCRYCILSKSPLTGFLGHSYSGGHLAIPMSRTGYDAFVIHGASEKPVWIEISDTDIQFHDATGLWGKDTYQTEDAVKSTLSDMNAGVMTIGPAGEKCVRFAVVENDYWRSAGRTGMGAIMGSKQIKAIAFHGSQKRPFADPEGIRAYSKHILSTFRDHKATGAYRNSGTPMMVAMLNTANAFPTRYWSSGKFENWPSISADAMSDRLNVKPKSCRTCFIGCGKLSQVKAGRHTGLKLEGPEYETIYAFGGLCMIDSIEEIVHLNDLCDRLGMDTISAGNLAALAIEASLRNLVSEKLEYGNARQVADLLQKISDRSGIGDILARGIKAASQYLGLADLAIHVKGLEPAGYDPRGLNGMALAYAVSDRGACHLRSTFYKAELAGLIPLDQVDGKAKLFVDFEDRCTLHDCLITCRFYRDFYTWDELSRIIELTTGMKLNRVELAERAAYVSNLARRFNIQEGMTPLDDTLPGRFFNEPLENGATIRTEDLDRMIQEYYLIRGWGKDGMDLNRTPILRDA